MFKAFTVDHNDIPGDVNRKVFETDGVEEYYDDYLVVQVDGKTIFCKPESGLSEGIQMIMELMELVYYLGVLDGVKYERGMGKSLKMLDAGKHQGGMTCPYCGRDLLNLAWKYWSGTRNEHFDIICKCGNNISVVASLNFDIHKLEDN